VGIADNSTFCLLCGLQLVKNGKTAAGTQRWKCQNCGASSVRKRKDVTRRHQLGLFLTWLIGKHSQAETDRASGREFRRATAWCWDVVPRLGPVTTTHKQVLVDGIWIGKWCLLIAVTESLEVLAWQWSGGETTAAWCALFERIPAPEVVVSDGGTGIASAVRKVWPGTKTQRCIFHVQMNIRRHLTMNPRSDAARRLRKLSLQLSKVLTPEDAIQWRLKLEAWWQAYGHLTKVRSSDGRTSWFTHDRLRKAWLLLAKVSREGTLFTYIEHGNARTTSPLEGGINSGIRTVLRNHRGMTEPHMKRAAEWFLALHEIPIDRAYELITAVPAAPETPIDLPARKQAVEPTEKSLYDSSLTAEEGLWSRSGWAGRG
jgi:hypothetical protein